MLLSVAQFAFPNAPQSSDSPSAIFALAQIGQLTGGCRFRILKMIPLPEVAGVEFRHISGFPGYCVGNDGSVWSCRRQGPGDYTNDSWHKKKPSFIDGYAVVTIRTMSDGRLVKVHRLVLEAFVGPCPKGMQTRHLNGIRNDNHLGNLKWGTSQENALDRNRHGTAPVGIKNPNAKLSESDVALIRVQHSNGVCAADIAKGFSITTTMVRFIVKRANWKHILKKQGTGWKREVIEREAP